MRSGKGNEDSSVVRSSGKLQMIDHKGNLDLNKLKKFMSSGGTEIRVVSIVGIQNSGKCYLLNKLFGTCFETLDDRGADCGKTTDGVWIGKCSGNPSLFLIDIEGSDSANHAADGPKYENQVALLALAISNVVILNFKKEALGQHQGFSVPLLKTIFKEVTNLDATNTTNVGAPKKRCRIVVVIRDINPRENLSSYHENIKNNKKLALDKLEEIWSSARQGSNELVLEDYFEVSVVQLPSHNLLDIFKTKCEELRDRLTSGDLQGPRDLILTGDAFSTTIEKIWTAIKNNKRLDIPSENELLSRHWCGEIKNDIVNSLPSNQDYQSLMEISSSPHKFYEKLQSFIKCTLEQFENHASCYVEAARTMYKVELRKCIIDDNSDYRFNELKERITMRLESEKATVVAKVFGFQKTTFLHDIGSADSFIQPHIRFIELIYKGFRRDYNDLIEIFMTRTKEDLICYTEKKIKEIQDYHDTATLVMRLTTVVGAVGTAGVGAVVTAGVLAPALLPEAAALVCASSQLLHTPAIVQGIIDIYNSATRKSKAEASLVDTVQLGTPALLQDQVETRDSNAEANTTTEQPETPELPLSSPPGQQQNVEDFANAGTSEDSAGSNV